MRSGLLCFRDSFHFWPVRNLNNPPAVPYVYTVNGCSYPLSQAGKNIRVGSTSTVDHMHWGNLNLDRFITLVVMGKHICRGNSGVVFTSLQSELLPKPNCDCVPRSLSVGLRITRNRYHKRLWYSCLNLEPWTIIDPEPHKGESRRTLCHSPTLFHSPTTVMDHAQTQPRAPRTPYAVLNCSYIEDRGAGHTTYETEVEILDSKGPHWHINCYSIS